MQKTQILAFFQYFAHFVEVKDVVTHPFLILLFDVTAWVSHLTAAVGQIHDGTPHNQQLTFN